MSVAIVNSKIDAEINSAGRNKRNRHPEFISGSGLRGLKNKTAGLTSRKDAEINSE